VALATVDKNRLPFTFSVPWSQSIVVQVCRSNGSPPEDYCGRPHEIPIPIIHPLPTARGARPRRLRSATRRPAVIVRGGGVINHRQMLNRLVTEPDDRDPSGQIRPPSSARPRRTAVSAAAASKGALAAIASAEAPSA